MTPARRIRASASTHVGLRRGINEDRILALPERGLWVVADGMGGHAGGDFAAQTVIDSIAAGTAAAPPADMARSLRSAILQAHDAIAAESRLRGGATIGATVMSLAVTGDRFTALWAGDSRLYRLRGGRIEMLSTDHSVVAGFVLAGQMTWDEAEHHPQSNAVTRAVGVGETLDLDEIDGAVLPGDRYLLCSDGLNRYAPFARLQEVLASAPLETVTHTLERIALEGGGADNISIIVVDIP